MSPDLPITNLQPGRVLVRGVNWLGDAVMMTPALARLRDRFPGARLVLLTPQKSAELWLRHPAVDEVLAFAPEDSLLATSRRLRAGGFDLAVVFPNSHRAALECRLAGIPRRLGYSHPWRDWLLTDVVLPRPDAVRMRKRSVWAIRRLARRPSAPVRSRLVASAHQVNEYLHLAGAAGADPGLLPPRLFVAAEEVEAAAGKFGLRDARPVFGLNAGAEYGPAKRWPVDRFISAAREIRKRTGCAWVLLGSAGEVALAGEIERALKDAAPAVVNLVGKTTLRELCAVLKLCRVLLTNDTGPMHVSAALGTPVVAPFGSTSPELTGPGLPQDPRHRLLQAGVPCSPCFRRECPIDFRCMTGITVEQVVEAVESVQQRDPGP